MPTPIFAPPQLSLQLQTSSEYWSDKVRTMSLQVERAEAKSAMESSVGSRSGKSVPADARPSPKSRDQ